MRNLFSLVAFILLCSPSLQVAAQQDESFVLKRKINLHVQDETIARTLDEISVLAEMDLSYNPAVISADELISVSCENEPVEQVLRKVLGDQFQFQVFRQQLIITSKSSEPGVPGFPDVPSPEVRKVSGLLLDSRTKEAVPFASISLLNKPFGTITNRDGVFELKIPERYRHDTLTFSCLGYARKMVLIDTLSTDKLNLSMHPVDIRLREIEVTAVNPVSILDRMLEHIADNYADESRLMTSFYREVLQQDKNYINVAEAIIQILKAPYVFGGRDDRIRFLKGRKSSDVEPFKWIDFKMQGGPYYITKLDVIKTKDTFIDPEYRDLYRFEMDSRIDYMGRPTYVILFRPNGNVSFPCYQGKLYVDQETFALVHAEFSMGKYGLKYARESLIRKKPRGFKVRPLDLDYQVNYALSQGRWHLSTAQTSVRFRVRSRNDKVNSVFHSVSDLLVTSHESTSLRRFVKDETFQSTDIFTETIIDYDEEFWGNFNVIQPDDDLRKAIKMINIGEQSLFFY